MRLVLVFSRWMSLSRWDELGMFERETALYRRLSARGVKVSFLTWGGPSELDYAPRLPGISILCNRFGLPPKRYEKLAPLLHAWPLWRADVIKTNQSSSAVIAVPAAKLWLKPLIARMGFMASSFTAMSQATSEAERSADLEREQRLFQAASAVVVTTREMAAELLARFPSPSRLIHVFPNYVDTTLFSLSEGITPTYDVLFIGRLAEQKNIKALLEALEKTGARALMIGDGEMADMVAAATTHGKIDWRRSAPNAELPKLIAQAKMLVLPSLWEGHPKVLIEAMSAGAAVIGADSPGIRNVIEHGKTGLLCPPDADGLAIAICSLKDDPERRSMLGANARAYVLAHCSLDQIVEQEFELLSRVKGRQA